jgi:DNA-binding transcriptional MerR regulator
MSELVERTGVPAATIRYYLVEHLLPPPHKIAANRFLYDERHVELVRLIRVLRERRGLSLESIGRLLPDLLPDLLGTPEGGIFNPAMWTEVLAAADPVASAATLREHLVDLATALFSERGYAEVTVDDVCRVANIA